MTGADLVVEELKARSVPFISTLNGHGLDPFYLACERAGMRLIDVRNEQAAAYMAGMCGGLTRSVGVCAVSGGVAHANALTGVLNAWFDGAPMLLITGVTPHGELGWGNFQDFNPVPMSGPICKYARMLDIPDRVPQMVHEAFAAATSGRPGPVHLALPLDVAAAEVDPNSVIRSPVRSGAVQAGSMPSLGEVEQLADLFSKSRRPLLVAGSGVFYSHGERALAEFVRQQQVPVVVPIWDRGSVEERLPQFMGVIGAASGGPGLLANADLVVLLGAELDYRVGQGLPPAVSSDATVVRVHSDSGRVRQGIESQVSITASPAALLEQLRRVCGEKAVPPCTDWLADARERLDAHRARCLSAADELSEGINARDLVLGIGEILTDDTMLLVDGGNIGQWFHQLLTDRYPGHWLTCGAGGVIGWGLPGAMAARALYPDRPVLLLSGDGSFTFTLGELECASRQGLPFVAVVADDEQWGISVTGQQRRHGRTLHTKLGPTRLDLVAQGLGCRGVRIGGPGELVPALREALSVDQVTVIQVPIVPGSPAPE